MQEPLSRRRKLILGAMVFIGVLLISSTFYFYQVLFSPNTFYEGEERGIYIESGSSFKKVLDDLSKQEIINDRISFAFVSKILGYQELVKGGYYTIPPKVSNMYLVRKLRSGEQTPIRVTFNNVRTKDDLIEKVSPYLELEVKTLDSLLNDKSFCESLGFSQETILSLFLPDTYEFYWNVSVESFFSKFKGYYLDYWSQERILKAEKLGLSPIEVSILASIVQAETQLNEEKPTIAGVYLNRIEREMPLQADPTVVYAVGDFEIKRVLNVHKEIDSPYNTYKNKGLPPGPINLPEKSSLDAVLNVEKHSYLYFCAKADFSGAHAFATNLSEHNRNARAYQRALNQRKIY